MLSFDRWRTGERSIQKFYGSYREGSRTWYAVIIGTDGCRQKQMFVTVFSSPCSITTCLCCIRREADDATTNYDVRRKAEIRLPYVGMSNRMPDFAVFRSTESSQPLIDEYYGTSWSRCNTSAIKYDKFGIRRALLLWLRIARLQCNFMVI